jgi:hypothetical protein
MAQEASVSVRLLIFSGRPDPEWALSGAEQDAITSRVRQLSRGEPAEPPPAGGLGYRGFVVMIAGVPDAPREVRVFRGLVALQQGTRTTHTRDTAGLEELLLQDARRRELGKLLDAAGIKAPGDR